MYFKQVKTRKWQLFGTFSNGKNILLRYAGDRQIIRHKLIKGDANPYNPVWNKYFKNRKKYKYAS
jgi:RNA-directed DNA polymerase